MKAPCGAGKHSCTASEGKHFSEREKTDMDRAILLLMISFKDEEIAYALITQHA